MSDSPWFAAAMTSMFFVICSPMFVMMVSRPLTWYAKCWLILLSPFLLGNLLCIAFVMAFLKMSVSEGVEDFRFYGTILLTGETE